MSARKELAAAGVASNNTREKRKANFILSFILSSDSDRSGWERLVASCS
jgi:hypothetical protein